MLAITITLVMVAEMINTAVEKTVDIITGEYHPLAKVAKNVAAGAVLLSAINALVMAYIIFVPYLR
jgi:diacylglycerol kinase